MAKTKFFRIAVEGTTVDGREIKREWLEQMARNYKPETYTARINCEHLKGFSPEPPFNAYGSVLALKTDEIELEIGGKTEKRLALFAQLDINDQLAAINKSGQKLFTSIEVTPNFSGTGEAYLLGLAVTDSPASLGTEILKFTRTAEATLQLEPEAETADAATGLFSKLVAAVERLTAGAPAETPAPAPAAPPQPANDNELATTVGELAKAMQTFATSIDTKVTAFGTKLQTLESQLANTGDGTPPRPLANGTDGFTRTDC